MTTPTIYRVQGDISSFSMAGSGLEFEERLGLLRLFGDFQPITAVWQPLACSKIGYDPLGDFAGFNLAGDMFVVFAQVLERPDVARLLRGAGELLPLTVGGQDAFALNVTRVLDVCDRDKSPMDYHLSGRPPVTNYPVFRGGALAGAAGFFRLAEDTISYYLAEPQDGSGFHALYQRHDLTGLQFEEQPVS